MSPRIMRTRIQDPQQYFWLVGHSCSPKTTYFWGSKLVLHARKINYTHFLLRGCNFFLALYSSGQLNFFSGSSDLQHSCYWWSIFSLFATITMKSEKLSFSYFIVRHWSKFVQHNYAAYQSKLCLKNRVKRIKTTE